MRKVVGDLIRYLSGEVVIRQIEDLQAAVDDFMSAVGLERDWAGEAVVGEIEMAKGGGEIGEGFGWDAAGEAVR